MQGPEGASFKGPLHCLRMGLRAEGPRFLTRGFLATCAREVPGNAIFFSVYETLRYALSPLAPSLPTASKDSNPAVAPSSTGMQASSSGRADPPSPVRSDSSSGNAWESLKGSYSPTSQTPAGSCMESMHSVDGSVSFPDLQSQTSSSSSSGSGGGGSSNSMQSSPGTHKVDAKVWREGTVAAAAAAAGKEGIGSSVDHSSSKAVGWKESISSSSGVSNSSPSSSNGSSPSSSGAPGVPSALSAILSGGISGVVMWSVVLPIDVAKTRLQTASPGSRWDASVAAHLRMLWRQGGVRTLYSGLTPTLVRAFPANAAQWLVWEATTSYLQSWSASPDPYMASEGG
mmetsp:Transcript_27363/g.70465  ORF Transcript_27363/g.70465 Transcript_27363/m.70465 type:complete len:343 (-) Transcript_27363:203-1231(-)